VLAPLADTHCHLDFNHFQRDRHAVLKRAWEAGLERILIPGVDMASSMEAVSLAEANPNVFAAIGVHPNSALTWDVDSLDSLRRLANHPKVCAVGEIGLDYYRDRAPKDLQARVFREQLALAAELGLPVVIHSRNPSPEDQSCLTKVLDILTEWRRDAEIEAHGPALLDRPGVLHSYSGNLSAAKQAVDLGFFIGVTGPVTFKNAIQLREVLASVPLEHTLVETDAPFLTPHPHRGKRNEPAYVRFVTERLSKVHNLPYDHVAQVTTENARQLFRWRD
jgi:TatD DNase family protein